MIGDICAEIKNYFVKEKHFGKFTIAGGKIEPLSFLAENQYFRIIGSIFNDGVYKNTAELVLTDEVFSGAVWSMAVPPSVIDLSAEIDEWISKGMGKESPYISESYPNGYSYTVATGSNGEPITWKNVFSKRLNEWRKISAL